MRASTSLSILLRRASRVTRAGLFASVVWSLGARLGVIATAVSVSRGAMQAALYIGAATTVCLAGQRLGHVLTRVRLERDLHRAIVEALLETDVIDVGRERTQRAVFEGCYHAVPLIGGLLPALVSDVIATALVIPVLISTFPERLLALGALAMLLILGGVILARRVAQRSEQKLNAAYEEVADGLLLAIEGRLEIVAHGRERAFEKRFAALTNRYVRRADRVGFVSAWLGRAPLLIGAVAVLAIALVDAPSRADLTLLLLTRALVLAACLPPLFGSVVGVQAVARTLALTAPLAQLLTAPHRSDSADGGESPSRSSAFEVNRVSFRYADDQPLVLSDVSLVWTPAEPLVLTGENGSGKSTLLKLLIGLRRPTAGAIRIGGRDLSTLNLRELRRDVVYLPQRSYLGEAHGTVRAAIQIAAPDIADREIEDALERVALLDAVRAHDGLSTTIGVLSTGQRQRLALARVLLQRAAIVILDEPDANLDRSGIAMTADLIKEMSAAGQMVALAAHTPELAALSARPVALPSRPR